jgi:hypothetical protein
MKVKKELIIKDICENGLQDWHKEVLKEMLGTPSAIPPQKITGTHSGPSNVWIL